jgi:uncharacterized repeat protein (TIGR01451 family)
VRVKKGLDNGSYIFNTVTIEDAAGVTDEATNVVQVHAEPILALTKTSAPAGEVKPGDPIKYTVCFANTGNGNATMAVLTDPIPVNTSYVAGSATGGGTYDAIQGTLTWDLGTIAPDANACKTFDVTVNYTIVGLTGQAGALSFAEWSALSIDNTATLSCDERPDLTATVSNPLNATVDPAIYKSVDKARIYPRESLLFTVTVTNRGTANATNVLLTDPIHPKLENLTFTASKGTVSYDSTTRLLTVNVGVLSPAETVTINIRGRAVGAPKSELPYQITDMATVAFQEGAARNSNLVTVDVLRPPAEIPEASTWLLMGSGLAGLAGYANMRLRARRRKAQ